MPKPTTPAAAGQRPSRSGYGSGAGGSSPPTRAATQPAARPIARHGLISRQTSPSTSDANGTPTQNATYTNQGAMLSRWLSVPARPGVGCERQHEHAERSEHDV